ncbi:molybdenum cofactor cytidylyltransferase [Flavobacterium aquidurense]|uniref:Molybdopterin-guanine dinucleotide biosynthesis protein MobA n=1 Tax=Flavobacterium frigidimaris TaxID=262320 RepID=A0ABX4BM02_FLAFR|nr:nucleotidyltransferase family protein [Flavobacterium frigidimaris]OXA76464.1 molybdopterin-guanine dinucleotide biosynthesis protein MobA [Flavobacterium frigidimaris]SDZ64557.1 molybdenum cofactor cytidylyltransferase [Flavobacterium aquidurense]
MTGIVILAAGNSSRLGQPKQLLGYKDSTLLKNTIAEAFLVPDVVIMVVTGANNQLIEEEQDPSRIKICFNPDWEMGMSSSIVKGLNTLLHLYPDCENCIFAVCDQPYVSSLVFESLIKEHSKTKKGIVASAYSGTVGTPVLFNKKYFGELATLQGQEGAKKIINAYLEDTVSVSFEKGNIDIDTEDDYNKLISGF